MERKDTHSNQAWEVAMELLVEDKMGYKTIWNVTLILWKIVERRKAYFKWISLGYSDNTPKLYPTMRLDLTFTGYYNSTGSTRRGLS